MSSLDIAATIVEAAGPDARAQVRETHPLDGVDLRPFLSGETDAPPHQTLLWRWHARDEGVIRSGDQKLIDRSEQEDLLFNLSTDLRERQNLLKNAIAEDGRASTLRSALEAWYEELIPPAHPGLGSWTFDDD